MIYLPFALLGAAAQGVQTILLRELLSLANGSEPVLAFGLSGWLLMAVVGGLLGDWLVRARFRGRPVAAPLLGVLLALPPATAFALLCARLSKSLLPGEPGNPLPLLWVGGISLFSCGIAALAHGLAFPLLLAHRRAPARASSAVDGGTAYGSDALGMAVAGALLSFLLLGAVPGFALAWAFACLPVAAILPQYGKSRRRNAYTTLGFAGAAVLGAAALWQADGGTRGWLWKHYFRAPMALLSVSETAYGTVETVAYQGMASVYRNGLLDQSLPGQEARDNVVHAAMLQVDSPRAVLLVNPGLGCAVWHVLAYSPQLMQSVDAPPDLIPSVSSLLCPAHRTAVDAPAMQRAIADPFTWLRRCTQHFDVVIVRVPEPLSLGSARFASAEFVREAARVVAPGGVLAFGPLVGGGPMGGGPFLARNRTMYDTFQQAAGGTAVTGGDTPWLLARPGGEPVDLDFASLWARAKARGIRVFSPAELCDEFGRKRNEFELRYARTYNPLGAGLPAGDPPAVSTLSRPSVVSQTQRAWLQAARDPAVRLFASGQHASRWWWLLATVPLFLALPRCQRRPPLPVLIPAMYSAGFWSGLILWSVLCLFQADRGSLAQHLAAINGIHMLGMGLGATAYAKLRAHRLALVVAITTASLATIGCLHLAGPLRSFPLALLMAGTGGLLPGLAFASLSTSPAGRELPGTLLAADLAGGLTGLVTGACVLLPMGALVPTPILALVPLFVGCVLAPARQAVG